jgi:2-oxoglutarate dehydrogenase complex dehydrogenase (E1) component-like enzyme
LALQKEGTLKFYNLSCISKRNFASPAVGKKNKHDEDQVELLKELFR